MTAPRVLVVDDEESLCLVLKDTLELEGYEVDVSQDIRSAREKLERSDFDAALLDVYLTDEPLGLALAAWIASHSPQTSIVLMTGYAEDVDVKAGYTSGAYGCIRKPFAIEDVLRVVGMVRVQGTVDRVQ